ncbi:MAG: hypothetical protein A2Y60_04210 [Chloroflexi bacterium RBG_13_54_9]|nr:MAG: hypothetical protein A2Y60_04210 [Chloroflexi bacterium RBG_13_54_9]
MRRFVILLLSLLLVLAGLACAGAKAPETSQERTVPEPALSSEVSKDSGDATTASVEQRLIVHNARISLAVADVLDARNQIAHLAESVGGYVVSSTISGEEGDVTGSISIRVPDSRFEQTLGELRSLATRVRSENTSAKDITEEYVDFKARLRNAEATEGQYLALLGKAKDTEETLKVYERLSQVRREIEQIKGKIQYLEQSAALSLIEIELRPIASARGLVVAGWNALEILKGAVRGLIATAQTLAALAIWLLVFAPLWGPVVAVILWLQRRRRKPPSGKAPGEETKAGNAV